MAQARQLMTAAGIAVAFAGGYVTSNMTGVVADAGPGEECVGVTGWKWILLPNGHSKLVRDADCFVGITELDDDSSGVDTVGFASDSSGVDPSGSGISGAYSVDSVAVFLSPKRAR